MGARVLEAVLDHPGFIVSGIVSERGRDHAAHVAREAGVGDSVAVGATFAELGEAAGLADVLFLATHSRLRDLEAPISVACRAGVSVVTSGEEAIQPWGTDSAAAARIDAEAASHGVAVVGAGVNPGFVMDLIPVALTGPVRRWTRIGIRRNSDLGGYGMTVLSSMGIGLTADEYEARRAANDVTGHIGFENSMALIGRALGCDLMITSRTQSPIVRSVATPASGREVPPGRVVGVSDSCVATTLQGQTVRLDHLQRLGTLAGEDSPRDTIEIDGDPPIRLVIDPGLDGASATVALMLNAAAMIVSATPGLYDMSSLCLDGVGRMRQFERLHRREKV